MNRACCRLIGTLILGSMLPAIASDEPDYAVIESFIARQARRERGEEYKEARQIVTGDVDHDGTPDTVVLYTIEGQRGSNLYIQYLAVFVRRNGKLVASTHTEAGGKNYRAIERVSIEDHVIRLETLEYTPKDASCCPSEKRKASYVQSGNRLKEQQKAGGGRR